MKGHSTFIKSNHFIINDRTNKVTPKIESSSVPNVKLQTRKENKLETGLKNQITSILSKSRWPLPRAVKCPNSSC